MPNIQTSSKDEGFSMIELLVGLVLIAISLFGIMSQSVGMVRGNRLADQGTTATALAQERIERFKGVPFADVASGSDADPLDANGDPGGIFGRSWVVTSTTVNGLAAKQLRVTVTWPEVNGSVSVVLSTLFTEVPDYGPGFPTVVQRSWRRL